MGYRKLALCAALVLACGVARAQPVQDTAAPVQNTVKLVRVLIAMPAGAPWLSLHIDTVFCIYNPVNKSWDGGREAQEISPYAVPFKAELERAGYKTASAEDNLFNNEPAASDYEAAAVITDARVEGCMSNGEYFTARGSVRGSASLKIDWQLYSRLKKQVVARVSTSGTAKLDKSVVGGVQRLITEAFATNVRELAGNADFRAALTAPRLVASKEALTPQPQSKIGLPGSLKAVKRPVADAVGSVVTIFAGSATGSGDLISGDGYILTNAHVVGGEKQVRVRWSDGIETVGEVIRVAKVRDVALIKTSSRDREPLPIKRGPVSPGQRVYAIGSPLGKEYQGTVSSGVISATRIIEGMRFIQSDVPVSHGSSGGALLDENGAMIGITVSGDDRPEAHGLYFFIPIGDAMDFLNLEQQ